MYKLEIIDKVKCETLDNETRNNLLGEFYTANFGIIHNIAVEQCISRNDYYDFMQIGWDALVTAVDAYSTKSVFSFLAFFRRTFKHMIFMHNLEFKYPMRIKNANAYRDNEYSFVSYGVLSDSYCDGMPDSVYSCMDEHLYEAENCLLRQAIITVLRESLSALQFDVIFKIFWENKCKRQVSEEIGLTYSQIRHAYTSALAQLRDNIELRRIAVDMFGIKV